MIWQVLGVAFVGVVAVIMTKAIKPEYAIFLALATSIVIIILVVDELKGATELFSSLAIGSDGEKFGSSIFFKIVKVVGIGYLTEYGAAICKDYGSESIGKKVQLAGKVSIFTIAVPIILEVVATIKLLIN